MGKKDRQPDRPDREIEAHDLPVTCFTTAGVDNVVVSGSKDGSIMIQNLETGDRETINIHGYQTGGVSYCSINANNSVIISGGYDGSLYVHKREDFDLAKCKKMESKDKEIKKMEELELLADSEVKHYTILLKEGDERAKEGEKDQIHSTFRVELHKIHQKLEELLQLNKEADDIEKLTREEFCLDIKKKNQMLSQADADVKAIIKTAEFHNLKEQMKHQKIKENTFDKMTQNVKTITGFKDNTIVFNFPLIKKEKENQRKIRLLKNLRIMELKERQWRKENNKPEYLALEDSCKKPIDYIVNAFTGKQKIILLNHAKREEERQNTKL